jgi:hypothetical protein
LTQLDTERRTSNFAAFTGSRFFGTSVCSRMKTQHVNFFTIDRLIWYTNMALLL